MESYIYRCVYREGRNCAICATSVTRWYRSGNPWRCFNFVNAVSHLFICLRLIMRDTNRKSPSITPAGPFSSVLMMYSHLEHLVVYYWPQAPLRRGWNTRQERGMYETKAEQILCYLAVSQDKRNRRRYAHTNFVMEEFKFFNKISYNLLWC